MVAADGVINQEAPKNVEWIRREKLLDFAKRNRKVLPHRIRRYMEWARV